MRRPSLGISHEPSTTASRFEAWFAARISGPSRGISSIAPSTVIRLIARPKIRPPSVSVEISGVIELSIGAGSSLMRWRRSLRLGRSAGLDVADRVDDRVDRVLEAVAVGRDDPCVRRGAERRDRTRRIELIAPAQRIEEARGVRAVRVEPALLGPPPRPLLDRRLEEDLEIGVGQDDRADVAPGHHDPAGRRQRALPSSRARRSSGIAETAETAASTAGLWTSVGVVRAVDEDARQPALGVGRELDLVDEAAHRVRVRRRHAARERQPGHGAVQQPRVAEAVADLERRGRADAALARRSGPVERDDEASFGAGSSASMTQDTSVPSPSSSLTSAHTRRRSRATHGSAIDTWGRDLGERPALQEPLDRHLHLLAGQRARHGRHGDDRVRHVALRQRLADRRPLIRAVSVIVQLDAVGQHHEQRHPVAAARQLEADHQAVAHLGQPPRPRRTARSSRTGCPAG